MNLRDFNANDNIEKKKEAFFLKNQYDFLCHNIKIKPNFLEKMPTIRTH